MGAVGVAAMVSTATGEAMTADERSPEGNQLRRRWIAVSNSRLLIKMVTKMILLQTRTQPQTKAFDMSVFSSPSAL